MTGMADLAATLAPFAEYDPELQVGWVDDVPHIGGEGDGERPGWEITIYSPHGWAFLERSNGCYEQTMECPLHGVLDVMRNMDLAERAINGLLTPDPEAE